MIEKTNAKCGDPTLFWIATLAVAVYAAHALAERNSDTIGTNTHCSATVTPCITSGWRALDTPTAPSG